MIYILIPSIDIESANQWVVDNCDPNGSNTFVDNYNGDCLISLPDNNSEYVETMKQHFGFTYTRP